MSIRGWVYIIDNEAMPNILKIGFSTKDPTLRAREFDGSASPYPHRVVFDVLVEEPRDVEQAAHAMLTSKREGKEWFRCSHSDAIAAIRACAKEIFLERNNSTECQSPQEQFELGKIYEQGNGVPQDYEEAAKWFRLAAEQGYAQAQSILGDMYDRGEGVPQDCEEAVRWYRLAADQGDAQAKDKIPIILPDRTPKYDGVVTIKRENQYRMATAQGDAEALYALRWKYVHKVDYNIARAIKEYGTWHGLSAGGRIQDYVGREVMQLLGLNRKAKSKPSATPNRQEESNKKLNLTNLNLRIWGAENGDALDKLILAEAYRDGNGLDQDDKQSTYWYQKAAEQGDKVGQAYLGIAYRDGRGIEQNDEQAVFWLRKAAEQGSEYGQVSLGCMYANVQGVVRNVEKAVYWFRQAAEQGDEEGQFKLAVMYEQGLGIGQDDEQAAYWYRKAAGQGDHEAQEALRRLGIDWKK